MKKIVVIGPESTGKSVLCEQLAQHYKTAWVPEYAREYLLKKNSTYHFDDLLEIAKGQLESENRISEKHPELPLLFIDTDMHVMKVWCEFVFEKCHHWILNRIAERKYDLYLLCNTDLSWVEDELREYPDVAQRVKLYHHYKEAMINQPAPWVNISGNYTERLQKAIAATDKII